MTDDIADPWAWFCPDCPTAVQARRWKAIGLKTDDLADWTREEVAVLFSGHDHFLADAMREHLDNIRRKADAPVMKVTTMTNVADIYRVAAREDECVRQRADYEADYCEQNPMQWPPILILDDNAWQFEAPAAAASPHYSAD